MFKLFQSFALVLAFACGAAAAAGPVDINTADAGAIASALKGVGHSKAEAIVAYRTDHGAFKSVDELVNVKGIGQKTVDANRDLIQVGSKTTETKSAEPANPASSSSATQP